MACPPTTSKKKTKSTAKPAASSGKSTTSGKGGKSGSSKAGGTKPATTGRSRKSAATTEAAAAPNITNYTSAMRWLNSHVDFEKMRLVPYNNRTFSLERMRKLLEALGNPQEQLRCVHVAGSKGKGSTCAMLASMLQSCGYTVGLFSSPHLVNLGERITINGQMISNADFTEILREISGKVGSLSDPPTYFEILTATALCYFAEQAVDVAVLETGLGGRLDSTNIITPLACGITQISLDHTNVLGDDLVGIAREKAGIFKKEVPAISVQQAPEVSAALQQVAEQKETDLEFTGQQIEFSYRFEANRELGPHTRVSITTPSSRFEHLAVPLQGEHQALNCGLALALLDKLKAHGFVFPEEKVVSGLAATTLPGRMEMVWKEPRIIIDGAHNAVSIQALIRALGAHISYDSLVMVFGCGQDKDVTGMLKQIGLGADKVIFTKSRHNPRAMEPDDLLSRFSDLCGKMSQTAPSLPDALSLANRAVSREDLIVVTGSFYLVGETKKFLADLANKRKR